jgi:hypothetical protein
MTLNYFSYLRNSILGRNLEGFIISCSLYLVKYSSIDFDFFCFSNKGEIIILKSGVIVNNPFSEVLSCSAFFAIPFCGFILCLLFQDVLG